MELLLNLNNVVIQLYAPHNFEVIAFYHIMDKLCYYFLPTFFSGTRVELPMLMIIILIKVDISVSTNCR